MSSRAEFLAATLKGEAGVALVDFALLSQVEGVTSSIPLVGIIGDTLADAVLALNTYPWLAHAIARTILPTPLAQAHLLMLMQRIVHGPEQPVLGQAGVGRVALLTSSTRREARFERMNEFFSEHKLSKRAVAQICDVAEELVTNALYDAPVEAGYYKEPVPRTEHVELPPEHACELSYGIENTTAFVRSRDPFGALTRARLLGVLNRCNATGVALDESRGGAGLGLWRVFSTASAIAITVIPGRLTDILVRFEITNGKTTKQTNGVHLFFPADHALDGSPGRFAADHDHDLMDESFTALLVGNVVFDS